MAGISVKRQGCNHAKRDARTDADRDFHAGIWQEIVNDVRELCVQDAGGTDWWKFRDVVALSLVGSPIEEHAACVLAARIAEGAGQFGDSMYVEGYELYYVPKYRHEVCEMILCRSSD